LTEKAGDTEKVEYRGTKLKGYIIGISLSVLSGLILGLSVPLLELAGSSGFFDIFGLEKDISEILIHPLFYIAIFCQISGGLVNYFGLTYIRAAIVTPIYGSIQIFEAVIIAQILLPITNPWSNLYLIAMILIVIAITLISYSLSQKPEQEVEDLLPPAPIIETPDEIINEGFSAVFELLDVNLIAPYGKIKHRWAMAGNKYPHPQYMESCFISLIWQLWMPKIALEILTPFFDSQMTDGRFPSDLKIFRKKFTLQPPLLAYTLIEQDPPPDFLKEIYTKLKKFNACYRMNRQTPEGLFFWKRPEESGMPQSPRFTNKTDISNILPVDLNVYIVLQNKALAKMARVLGKPSEAEEFEIKATDLIENIRRILWDPSSNMFYDKDIEKDEFIKILSLTNFTPLIAGIPSEEQVNSLLEILTDKEKFYTQNPWPSVAISDNRFRPAKSTGAVSIFLAYLILQGLKDYNKDRLVSEISYRLVKNCYSLWKESNTFFECYSPDTSRYTLSEKISKDFIGSTGLINNLLVQNLLGFYFDSEKIILKPRLPEEWKNKVLKYHVPVKNLMMELEFDQTDVINVTININSTSKKLIIKNYEKQEIPI